MYYDSWDIPYKDLLIVDSDIGFIKIYDYDSDSDCYCVLLKSGYMSVEDAKAWIDGKRAVDELLEKIEEMQEGD